MTIGRPESFIFAFKDQGTTWAVRVDAGSFDGARAIYGAMSRAERLRNVICAMERDETDHASAIGAWVAALFRRAPAETATR